jgi:hypothetical protein
MRPTAVSLRTMQEHSDSCSAVVFNVNLRRMQRNFTLKPGCLMPSSRVHVACSASFCSSSMPDDTSASAAMLSSVL